MVRKTDVNDMGIVGIVELRVRNDDSDNLDVLGGYAKTRQCNVRQRNVAGSRGWFHLHIFQRYRINRDTVSVAVRFSGRRYYRLGGLPLEGLLVRELEERRHYGSMTRQVDFEQRKRMPAKLDREDEVATMRSRASEGGYDLEVLVQSTRKRTRTRTIMMLCTPFRDQ